MRSALLSIVPLPCCALTNFFRHVEPLWFCATVGKCDDTEEKSFVVSRHLHYAYNVHPLFLIERGELKAIEFELWNISRRVNRGIYIHISLMSCQPTCRKLETQRMFRQSFKCVDTLNNETSPFFFQTALFFFLG